jgi:ATP-dependent RNA helicase DDX51/DBP6
LLLKREKSIKKAEKLVKKAARVAELDSGDEKDGEDIPELHPLEPIPQPEPVPETTNQTAFTALPPWLATPIKISPHKRASFAELGVPGEAIQILKSKGFEEAFAVQAAVLPILLPGAQHQRGDVLVSAATGSGKTLAYVLPAIEDISKSTIPRLRALIVMPTRELVIQVRSICEICATAFAGNGRRHMKIGIAVGSQTLKSEQSHLIKEELKYDPEEYNTRLHDMNSKWEAPNAGTDESVYNEFYDDVESMSGLRLPLHVPEYTSNVDVLICTPGRLVEHLRSTPGFTLDFLKWLIIDEADKLLDQSFQQWLEKVMTKLPKDEENMLDGSNVTKIILSATMTREVEQLSELKLYRPKLVILEDPNSELSEEVLSLPSTLYESAVKVANDGDKPLYLLHLLKNHLTVAPSNGSSSGVLVFTKSNEAAARLGRLISLLEPTLASKIGTLTAAISLSTRKATVSSFNAGKTSILFASDLASRGLDLPELAHVINYDMPTSLTSYVHRVGRTARAEKDGNAWTLFTNTEARWFWNDIARSPKVRRTAGKVARLDIDASKAFSDMVRESYVAALEKLGQEATS